MELSSEEKIMNIFFKFPTKTFSFRDIERKTNLSIGTVSKYMKKLKRKKYINFEKKPNAIYANANLLNKKFRFFKKIFNLRSLYTCGLIEFLNNKFRPDAIVLIGSYSKGEDREKSDIDMCLTKYRNVEVKLNKYEKKLKREINLIKIKKSVTDEFKDSLINGIVLYGYLELK